jgi:hypothetical protein
MPRFQVSTARLDLAYMPRGPRRDWRPVMGRIFPSLSAQNSLTFRDSHFRTRREIRGSSLIPRSWPAIKATIAIPNAGSSTKWGLVGDSPPLSAMSRSMASLYSNSHASLKTRRRRESPRVSSFAEAPGASIVSKAPMISSSPKNSRHGRSAKLASSIGCGRAADRGYRSGPHWNAGDQTGEPTSYNGVSSELLAAAAGGA